MATTKVFLTGASGYLGGETLYQLSRLARPIQLRCLVRDAQKAAAISEAYPTVGIVPGDLDDSGLIEREARDADVVLHLASTKHEGSSRAIVAGLSSSRRQQTPTPGGRHWIQISGASMFSNAEVQAGRYGEPSDRVYDDVRDVAEIIHEVIRSNPARVVDILALDQDAATVRTALLPGPLIYGEGRGPLNRRSIQGPEVVEYTLRNGRSFAVGKGQAAWSNVHVSDVGAMIVLLLEAAIDGRDGLWNQDGIFFPEAGLMSFGDIAKRISQAAVEAGLIASDEVKSLTPEEADQFRPHSAVLFGTNARLKSSRARRDLGWSPSGPALEDTIVAAVQEESKRVNSG